LRASFEALFRAGFPHSLRPPFRGRRAAVTGSLATLILYGGIAMCHADEGERPEGPAAKPLEEVIVRGRSMGDLRSELYRAQEQFYSVFNALNSDDEYDIHCEYRAPVGSHIRRRVCVPNFVGELTAESAKWMMMHRGDFPVRGAILRKHRELRAEMARLAVEYPELGKALGDLVDARRRWEGEGDADAAPEAAGPEDADGLPEPVGGEQAR
jgi:hypothetical protein